MKALLAVIAATLVGLLVVGIVFLTRGDSESPERQKARDDAKQYAEYVCTLDFTGSIDSEEYENCVERETETKMKAWDRAHLDD